MNNKPSPSLGPQGSHTMVDHGNWEVCESAVFEEVGRLKFELDWLKKKSVLLGVLKGGE